MKRILRHPALNAVCLSLFTAFYGLIFLVTAGHEEFGRLLYYFWRPRSTGGFWDGWSAFLVSGKHVYIAWGLIAVTLLVVALLGLRRHPYDEYHTSLLLRCLAVASVLTLAAIAVFYLMILSEPAGIVEKFTLFIVIHWATVVLSDLAYVLLCRWR